MGTGLAAVLGPAAPARHRSSLRCNSAAPVKVFTTDDADVLEDLYL
ncbi:unnamed protein product, partial [Arabidopsis halleri]